MVAYNPFGSWDVDEDDESSGDDDTRATANAKEHVWAGVRTRALAIHTALKKVDNDTSSVEPQINPAKSNNALGTTDSVNTFKKVFEDNCPSMALRVLESKS